MLKLHISPGNSKLGSNIPSVSFSPEQTCRANVPCKNKCYARRLAKFRPTVQRTWETNFQLWKSDPEELQIQLQGYLIQHRPRRFRWFVGGDIPDKNFLQAMVTIAEQHPNTKFMAYTKKFHLLQDVSMPSNLNILLGLWAGDPCNGEILLQKHAATVFVPKGQSVDETLFTCPGSCAFCNVCWVAEPGFIIQMKEH